MKTLISFAVIVFLSLEAMAQSQTTVQEATKSACGVAGHDHPEGEDHPPIDAASIEEMRQKALAEMERYYRENKDLNGFDEEAYQQRLQAILNPPRNYSQSDE